MIKYILQTSIHYDRDAAYNRVRLFYKGLVENNVSCDIERIEICPSSKIRSQICFFLKGVYIFLKNAFKLDKRDILIIYGETYFTFLYKILSYRTNLVLERTEYPAHMICENISKRGLKNSLRNSNALTYADAIITCSTYLQSFYQTYCHRIIISPLVVDLADFNITRKVENPIGSEYIAYCGSLNNNKDGVPILIQAYSMFRKKNPSVKLVIIGGGTKETVDNLKKIIIEENIVDDVVLLGAIDHAEISNWLKNAVMLALARPNNKQAEGGIPSKVGEYLASGVPSVITSVGDLPRYLHDGIDCFIAEPDSIISFADKMQECYNSDRNQITNKALEVVQQFDYLTQAKVLLNKLEDIYGKSIKYN